MHRALRDDASSFALRHLFLYRRQQFNCPTMSHRALVCDEQANRVWFVCMCRRDLWRAIYAFHWSCLTCRTLLLLTPSAYFHRSLCWQMHPPTSFCFVKHLLLLLPQTSLSADARHDLLELARFLTELSVIDYYFVIHHSSTIALAALLNAVDEVPSASEVTADLLLASLQKVSRFPAPGEELAACRSRLRLLYAQGGYSHPTTTPETRPETVSPVCVSYGCTPYGVVNPNPTLEEVKPSYSSNPAIIATGSD